MTGRNEPCPCGSGQKYKKCCLKKEEIALSSSRAARSNPFTQSDRERTVSRKTDPTKLLSHLKLSDFTSADSVNTLPFLTKPLSKAIDAVTAYLESDALQGHRFGLTPNDGIFLTLSFEKYGRDLHDSIDVILEESGPDQTLQLRAYRNSRPCPLSEASLQIDAALFLLLMALANDVDRSKLPEPISLLRRDWGITREEQKKIVALREEWFEKLESISLTSATLNLMPGPIGPFASSTPFPVDLLPDQMPKLKPVDLRNNRRKSDPIRSFANLISSALKTTSASSPEEALPEIFLRPLEEIHFYWPDKPELLQLSEFIQYNFSDGSSITAREILRHPFAFLLPPDLLPGTHRLPGSERFWARRFQFDPKSAPDKAMLSTLSDLELIQAPSYIGFKSPPLMRTESVVRDLLARLIARLNRDEIEVHLIFPNAKDGSGKKQNSRSLRLAKIQVGARSLFNWHLQLGATNLNRDPKLSVLTADVTLQPTNPAEAGQSRLPFRNGFIDLTARTLWLHPLSRDIQAWDKVTFGTPSNSSNSSNTTPGSDADFIALETQVWPAFKAKFSAKGADTVHSLERFLHSRSNESFGFAGEKDKAANGTPERLSATPEIHMDSEGGFLLVRRLSPTDANRAALSYPFLNGVSFLTVRLLKTLAGGLPFYFDSEARDMATRARKTRDFELKLFKHMGVVNLLMMEALSARLNGHLTDGTLISKPDEILPRLQAKIVALMMSTSSAASSGDEDKTANPLARHLHDFCSKSSENKLSIFINDIFLLCRQPLRSSTKTTSETSPETSPETQQVRDPHAPHSYLPDGDFTIDHFVEDEMRMLLTILEQTMIESTGDIFTKARLNLLQSLFPFEGMRLPECRTTFSRERIALHERAKSSVFFKLPQVSRSSARASQQDLTADFRRTLATFYPLVKFGFELYLDGQRIEELSDADFRTELALQDKPSSIPGELGSGSINWFELNPRFFLHGEELDSADARRLLTDGMIEHDGRYYLIPAERMPSLRKLSNFWERLQRGKSNRARSSLSQQVFPIAKSQVLEMLALRSAGIPVVGGPKWQEICAFYDNLDASSSSRAFALPSTIHADLKDYQTLGVRRLYELYRLGMGSILADDMGLGKTLQTLSFLERLREEQNMGSVLIVVPTSLTYNWMSERDKFTPQLPMLAFSSKAKDVALDFLQDRRGHDEPPPRVLLTTYGLLQEHKEFFQQIHWNLVIFDEAQNLKTITTQRTATARALNASVKICLTGTPLENHLGEFYSLLDLVVPGCLGDVDDFRQTYVNPPSIPIEDIRFLKLKAKPLVLRRTKKEILSELPEKRESRVVLPFEEKQKKIYRDIAISYNEKIQKTIAEQGEAKCQLQMLTALLRLRQACSDPAALPGVKYAKTPPKIESLKDSLMEIVDAGESALVFTQFLNTMERTRRELKEAGLPVFAIHGGLSRSQRENILREFNSLPSGSVLVMTLKTGGVGLNLTKASYVFHLEPWWNPAVENQATDRAHRIGQKRAVQVYRYIMHESVEEKIELLKSRKEQRFNAMFTEVESAADTADSGRLNSGGSHLSKEDFAFLLR